MDDEIFSFFKKKLLPFTEQEMLSTHSRRFINSSIPLGRRTFLIATLAALTNSNFVKEIQMADEMEGSLKLKQDIPKAQPIKESKPKPNPNLANGAIELNGIERAVLFLSSGIQAYLHPEIGRNINNFGEASSFDFILTALRDEMLSTPDGRYLLRHQPLMNDQTLPVEKLNKLPENTLGYQYYKFTRDGDARAPVRFIADKELNYVFTRYRQIHDIVHILTESKIDLAGELPVKAFEFGNTGLPMTGLACFAYFKLSKKRKAKVNMVDSYINGLSTVPLVSVRWEELLERDVDELRKEFGIQQS